MAKASHALGAVATLCAGNPGEGPGLWALDPRTRLREDVSVDSSANVPWWKGARGEWYVVAQVLLFVLVIFGPRSMAGMPTWTGRLAEVSTVMGIVLMVAGGGLLVAAFTRLGKNLTPLPYPKDDGRLVQTGAYSLVRHPIYCGAIALALGWAHCVHGPLTLGYTLVLFAFLDVKSRREERWLAAKYSDYADYRKKVRKLIPFVY
jgi:protein-S-isoprenylcysteine O-methyltransferase Ste14